MRRLLIFWGGVIAVFLLVLLPIRFFSETRAQADLITIHGLTALLLCLIPTSITLALSQRALKRGPNAQLLLVMGGTGIRMLFVLLAGLALYMGVELYRRPGGLWIWILALYMVTLAWEMTLMLMSRPSEAGTEEIQPDRHTEVPPELQRH